MTRLKTLALSGVVLSFAATGWAMAQSTTTLAQPPVQEPMSNEDMQAPGDDLDDAAMPDDRDDAVIDAAEAATVAPPPAADGKRQDRRGGRMGGMDADGDGAIGKAEFQARRAERLRGADADGDGTLSTDELEAMVLKDMAERRVKRLERGLDIDGDGRVTLAEIESMRAKRFALMDRNDDGRIDDRELAAMHQGMGPGEMRGGGEGRRFGWNRDGDRRRHHGEGRNWHAGEGWRHPDHGGMPDGRRGDD